MSASVVLVDDHHLVRDGIRALIDACDGFSVVAEGCDGCEAIALAAKHKPDIVLLDIWMPSLSGINALTQIRRESPRSRVLMMSQHEKGSYIREALRKGACGYVLKSAGGAELLDALRAAKEGKCYLANDIAQAVVENFAHPPGEATSRFHVLTGRELEIVQLIAEGMSSKEVAAKLSISVRTVESHRTAITKKLEVRNVAELVRFAIREGLIAP